MASIDPMSQPFVSTIFADNMVLQRGKKDAIWGWSEPGDRIQVEFGGHTAAAVAGEDHRWQVSIEPPAMGGPYTLHIWDKQQSVVLKNVLVGDVWLCGGQSNMQLPLFAVNNSKAEIKAANDPEIRFFSVMPHVAYHPVNVVQGMWQAVTPEDASWLSAVAYFFARKVREETHVPIGLIVDAVGGTPAESWTSATALGTIHDFDVPLAALAKLQSEHAPEYGNYIMHWYDQYDVGQREHWESPALDDAGWKQVTIPGGFAGLGVPTTPAVAWFRKQITLPDPLPNGRATIFLGSIQRMDTVYINGKLVGASAWVENPRVYGIRPGVLHPGVNEIAIRVFKTEPKGGFLAKPEELHLVLGDKSSIPLAGAWKGKLSVDARPPQPMPLTYENWPVMPSVLYEGMLRPLAPLSLAGAIWYQGEQNSDRGYAYRRLLPVMIADWRNTFDQGNFPFYIVSLPAYLPRSATPVSGDPWTETRESQAITAATVPNTCLAVTIDTGEADSIHPKEKVPVGNRLALCALAGYYHKKVVDQGPTFARMKISGSRMKIYFAHANGGLVAKGGKAEEFSLAGADQKWHWADARIEGKTIVLTSPDVPHPVAARYAWQSNPRATLYNGAGLPAVPFRTDNWTELTQNARPY
jgi:sialate O-acetylesterase